MGSILPDTLEFDPTFMLWGVGLLALAMFLLGHKPEMERKKARKTARKKKVSELRQEIKKLESEGGWF